MAAGFKKRYEWAQYDDLVKVALRDGVWKASKSWKPDGGASFETYARTAMEWAIQDHLQRIWPHATLDLEKVDIAEGVEGADYRVWLPREDEGAA